jgi:hypothetical protein
VRKSKPRTIAADETEHIFLTNIYLVRVRDMWLWLGGAFITGGSVLTALAIAYYTKEQHYALSTGPQMTAAYFAFAFAFLCFLAAITAWRPWQRWQRFPNLTIRIDAYGTVAATQERVGIKTPVSLVILKLHITNNEVDRRASIRAVYLLGRCKPGSTWGYWHVFTAPTSPASYENPRTPVELPMNLEPQASDGGWLIFELTSFLMDDVDWSEGSGLELHDAVTGKMATCPAAVGGSYRRRHGLRVATLAERVTGPEHRRAWNGLLGPSDPDPVVAASAHSAPENNAASSDTGEAEADTTEAGADTIG